MSEEICKHVCLFDQTRDNAWLDTNMDFQWIFIIRIMVPDVLLYLDFILKACFRFVSVLFIIQKQNSIFDIT